MIERIYEIDDLEELGVFLSGFSSVDALREELFREFLKFCMYRTVDEWNKAVRICECLAIVGWGAHEAVEAVRGVCFNGSPNTFFINRFSKPRFFDAAWSKRNDGYAIDFSRSSFHESPDALRLTSVGVFGGVGESQALKICSQRNWILKNPVCITRGIANCYENSKAVIDSMANELMPMLDRRMRPELYGRAIDRIVLDCSFSFYDDYHCKTNYIIADESLKLKQKDFYPALLEMFTEEEIEDSGYYLRNRFSYGPFRPDSGTTTVRIVFEKEFSELSQLRQKQLLSEYFLTAVRKCAGRLCKKVDYDFDLMIDDFAEVLCGWCK